MSKTHRKTEKEKENLMQCAAKCYTLLKNHISFTWEARTVMISNHYSDGRVRSELEIWNRA
jgi:hypothetical protein